MEERLDKLLARAGSQNGSIADQAKRIGQQADSIALLTQSVAMLLGEEIGTPLADDTDSAPRADLDGNPY